MQKTQIIYCNKIDKRQRKHVNNKNVFVYLEKFVQQRSLLMKLEKRITEFSQKTTVTHSINEFVSDIPENKMNVKARQPYRIISNHF